MTMSPEIQKAVEQYDYTYRDTVYRLLRDVSKHVSVSIEPTTVWHSGYREPSGRLSKLTFDSQVHDCIVREGCIHIADGRGFTPVAIKKTGSGNYERLASVIFSMTMQQKAERKRKQAEQEKTAKQAACKTHVLAGLVSTRDVAFDVAHTQGARDPEGCPNHASAPWIVATLKLSSAVAGRAALLRVLALAESEGLISSAWRGQSVWADDSRSELHGIYAVGSPELPHSH